MIDLHLIAVTYITRMQNHDQKILLAKTYGVENICDYAAIEWFLRRSLTFFILFDFRKYGFSKSATTDDEVNI